MLEREGDGMRPWSFPEKCFSVRGERQRFVCPRREVRAEDGARMRERFPHSRAGGRIPELNRLTPVEGQQDIWIGREVESTQSIVGGHEPLELGASRPGFLQFTMARSPAV